MRRAREREMEGQQQNHDEGRVMPTKFYNKVMEIPVVKFGVDRATGFYGKVKDFNTITQKSFILAETVTGAVVTRVSPFAQKGIDIAGEPLKRIDSFAAQGLQTLEDKVPVINKEPNMMVSDVKGAVSGKYVATKDRVSKVSEVVLASRPVQTYFNLLEFVLATANNALDKVLPPDDSEEVKVNGVVPEPGHDNTTEKKAERGWLLLAKFFGLMGTAKTRALKKIRSRIEDTSNAANAVFKEAKKTANNAISSGDQHDDDDGEHHDGTNGSHKKGNKKGHKHAERANALHDPNATTYEYASF